MPAYTAGTGVASVANRSASPRDRLVIRQRQCDKEYHGRCEVLSPALPCQVSSDAGLHPPVQSKSNERGYCRPRIGVYPCTLAGIKGLLASVDRNPSIFRGVRDSTKAATSVVGDFPPMWMPSGYAYNPGRNVSRSLPNRRYLDHRCLP